MLTCVVYSSFWSLIKRSKRLLKPSHNKDHKCKDTQSRLGVFHNPRSCLFLDHANISCKHTRHKGRFLDQFGCCNSYTQTFNHRLLKNSQSVRVIPLLKLSHNASEHHWDNKIALCWLLNDSTSAKLINQQFLPPMSIINFDSFGIKATIHFWPTFNTVDQNWNCSIY